MPSGDEDYAYDATLNITSAKCSYKYDLNRGIFFHWKVKISVSCILGIKCANLELWYPFKDEIFGVKTTTVIFICKIIVGVAHFSAT